MKLSTWIASLLGLTLMACSSTPTHQANSTQLTARDQFTTYADSQVEYWESTVDNLDGDREARLEPYVANLKADVEALKNSGSNWTVYQQRVENGVEQLRNEMEAE